jgi:adenine deaminase
VGTDSVRAAAGRGRLLHRAQKPQPTPVIGILPGKIITERRDLDLTIDNGEKQPDLAATSSRSP